MKIFQLVLVCGLAACSSDPATTPPPATTTPTISGVVPDRGFVGRDVRVEISGDATQWVDGTTVAFGTGVTVHSVAVVSPTSLFAEVSVADTAPAGLADVTVTGADSSLVLHKAFDIEPPLRFTTVGTLAQGSIVDVTIANEDFDNPFDTTSILFGGAFPNIDIEGPPGTAVQTIVDASAFEVEAILTIDVDAQPGELVINSGPHNHGLRLSAGNLDVAPRTAIPITANTVITGGAVGRFETVLYEITPAPAPSATLVSSDGFNLLPASGHWADSLTFSTIPTFDQLDAAVLASEKYYVIYGDSAFPTDSYQIQFLEYSLTQTNETAAANDTGATAQPIQLPAMFADATLSSDNDADFVKFQIDPADIGKTVRVITEGDAGTVIDVFADRAATISLGESNGGSFDDFTSLEIPDGTTTVYVKFSASAGGVDPELSDYLAAIFLQ